MNTFTIASPLLVANFIVELQRFENEFNKRKIETDSPFEADIMAAFGKFTKFIQNSKNKVILTKEDRLKEIELEILVRNTDGPLTIRPKKVRISFLFFQLAMTFLQRRVPTPILTFPKRALMVSFFFFFFFSFISSSKFFFQVNEPDVLDEVITSAAPVIRLIPVETQTSVALLNGLDVFPTPSSPVSPPTAVAAPTTTSPTRVLPVPPIQTPSQTPLAPRERNPSLPQIQTPARNSEPVLKGTQTTAPLRIREPNPVAPVALRAPVSIVEGREIEALRCEVVKLSAIVGKLCEKVEVIQRYIEQHDSEKKTTSTKKVEEYYNWVKKNHKYTSHF